MKMKITVEEYLRKHRVLTRFKKNVTTLTKYDINRILNSKESYNLKGAFSWLDSPEGSTFWANKLYKDV